MGVGHPGDRPEDSSMPAEAHVKLAATAWVVPDLVDSV